MLMLKTLLTTLALLLAVLISPVSAEEAKVLRSISISGHGEVRAVPDVASVTIGVTSNALTARDALDNNTKTMKNLLDTLKKAGIDPRDLTTSNFTVGPRYDYGNNNGQPAKITGYDVNNMVTVTVREITDLGELLDVAVTTGSNTINGVTFNVSKADALLNDARKAAVAAARQKAEIYAAAGGFKLGKIIQLNEGAAYAPPAPYSLKQRAAVAEDAVPVAEGEQTLGIDVSITYEIN
jgi:uncharacterized protein